MPRKFIPAIGTIAPVGYDFVFEYTSGVFHAYADSSRPDDSGDGLSWLTAKKTLAAAIAVFPNIVANHAVLHLKGSFTVSGTLYLPIRCWSDSGRFIVDGGDDVDVVDGPYTATSSTTTSITDTARSWTVDQLQGYAVEILDGPAAGYIYTIMSNTADTINVNKTWPAPGTCQYRITRPGTLITASASTWMYFNGDVKDGMWFQRLRFSGAMYVGASTGQYLSSTIYYSDLVFESGATRGIFCGGGISRHIISASKADPINPGSLLSSTTDQRVMGHRNASATYAVYANFVSTAYVIGVASLKPVVKYVGVNDGYIYGGSALKSLYIERTIMVLGYGTTYGNATVIDGSSALGIEVIDSRVKIGKNFIVQNSVSHGIQLDNSTLECLSAVLSGSGNAGAGVYLKNKASVLITDGYTPTLTGTLGDYSFDGTTDGGTWAEVDGGTPVASLTRFCNVVEVV